VVIGVFSRRLRDGVNQEEYAALDARMLEIVSSNPEYGLRGVNSYSGPDGVSLVIALFETMEGMRAWRRHVEHRQVQQRGRDEFFDWYWGLSCTVESAYEFRPGAGRVAATDPAWLPPGFAPRE
jgi:heme-degrading monooxygenase HmoA